MSLLDNARSAANVTEEAASDSLGGVFMVDSGVYNFIIEVAYLNKSSGGAVALNMHLKDGNTMLRQTVYITSGDKKGNKPTYTDKKTGEEKYLPGRNQINELCKIVTGNPKGIDGLSDPEEKIIKLYNFDARKEVDTKVEMVMDLVGQPVTLGIQKIIENKSVKNDSGAYVKTNDKREINEIAKIFRAADGLSMAEIDKGATESLFKADWAKKNTGVSRDKFEAVAGAPAGAAPVAAGAAAVAAKLFD